MHPLRILALILSLGMAVLTSEAAVSIGVEYKGKYYKAIDAKRALPVIEVDGKKRSVTRSKIRMYQDQGSIVEDGFYSIRNKKMTTRNQTMQGGPQSRFLVFRAEIKTSVALKDNFIAVSMKNKFGQSRLVVYEIPNFKAEKWTKVSFSVPTDNSEGGGGSKQYVFSNGSQVLNQKEYNQTQRRKKR